MKSALTAAVRPPPCPLACNFVFAQLLAATAPVPCSARSDIDMDSAVTGISPDAATARQFFEIAGKPVFSNARNLDVRCQAFQMIGSPGAADSAIMAVTTIARSHMDAAAIVILYLSEKRVEARWKTGNPDVATAHDSRFGEAPAAIA